MRPATDPIPSDESAVDSITDLARDQAQKKKRTMLVLFGVIPIAAAVIGVAWWYFGSKAATEDIARAWSDASGCLVGAPLADGDKASLRMRAIQLTALHLETDQKDARWPMRCGDSVAALFEALRRHGKMDDGPEGLSARAEPLAVALRKADVMDDLSRDVDGLFAAALAMGLRAEPVTLQVPTPEPAKAFNLDTLPATSQISPLQYTLDNVSAPPMVDTDIHVLVYDKKVDDKPILCAFVASGEDRCRQLGGPLVGKSGLALSGTVDPGASPLVLAGHRGTDGVFRSDGAFEKITAMDVQSAYVAKDGYVALTGWAKSRDKGEFDLVEQAAPDAPLKTTEITPEMLGKDAYQAHRVSILWGRLMVQGLFGDPENGVAKLMAADLPVHGDKPKFREIAEVNWLNASIFGCRTGETTVVGVGESRGFVTFYEKASWSPPVPIDWLASAVSCHSGEVVFTEGAGNQMRCTPAGCNAIDGVEPKFDPFNVKQAFWADLGGKVLAVASTKGRGGLRYRLADGKNLGDRGADQILFDDMIKDGVVQQDSTLLGMLIAGRGNYAVSLMTTPKGVYALRFDSDGLPKPANLKR